MYGLGVALCVQEASYEYMVKEGERMFLECLDQLEVAYAKVEDVRC